jgi:hypothetical protein
MGLRFLFITLHNEVSLLASLFLESVTGKVKDKRKGLNVNGKHEQLLVFADEFNVMGVNGNAVNTEGNVLCRLKLSSENYVCVMFTYHKQTVG